MNIKIQLQVAKNLRALRRLSDLSQAKLAYKIGVSRSSYTQYEIGDRLPDLVTLIDISDFYHVNTDTLIHGDVSEVTKEYFLEKDRQKDEAFLLSLYTDLTESSKGRLLERATILREADVARHEKGEQEELSIKEKLSPKEK